MTDVGRHEVALRVGADQHPLHALLGGAPDREPPVAVMIVQHHRKGTLALVEERRRAVAQPLARVGQRETDLTDLAQRLGGVGVRRGSDASQRRAPRRSSRLASERAASSRSSAVSVITSARSSSASSVPSTPASLSAAGSRLLEDRAGEARVPEALAATGAGEDPLELPRRPAPGRMPRRPPACG